MPPCATLPNDMPPPVLNGVGTLVTVDGGVDGFGATGVALQYQRVPLSRARRPAVDGQSIRLLYLRGLRRQVGVARRQSKCGSAREPCLGF